MGQGISNYGIDLVIPDNYDSSIEKVYTGGVVKPRRSFWKMLSEPQKNLSKKYHDNVIK